MSRKSSTQGMFAAIGRAVDESMDMAMAVRTGKMSRAEYERWWDRRMEDGRDYLRGVRDQAMRLTEPALSAADFGRSVLRSAATANARPRPRRRRPSSRRPSSRRPSRG